MKSPVEKTPQENILQDIQEIGITLFGKNLNPAVLSMDFLKLTAIIPDDWELAQQPVYNHQLVQLNFKNNVTILAQPGNITFREPLVGKDPKGIHIPTIAKSYVQKIPNGEYQRISNNAQTIVPLYGGDDAAKKYITDKLLAPGSWRNIGEIPVGAGINLFYFLGKSQLTININEARLQQPNQATVAAVIFAGIFNYNLVNPEEKDPINQLIEVIDNWEPDWKIFTDVVYDKFLEGYKQEDQNLFSSRKS